ncbi:hypothetical protein B0H34DRAFT_662758, partial [Crassisporium funariophilum]
RNIMRDNQLLNLTGLPGHSMPVDLNIEHTIGELKVYFSLPGLETTWDHLGDISSAIDYLKGVKNQVLSVMELLHKSKGHSDVDTTNLVWKVANTARDNHLQEFNANRAENRCMSPIIDIIAVGEAKLKSSSLATFNKRIQGMVEGRRLTEDGVEDELEVDELPRNELQLNWNSE